MGFFEPESLRVVGDAHLSLDDARINPIEFNPDNYNPEIQYLLPHELTMLRKALSRMSGEQGELGSLLAEAMDQSSETAHDNAPQEVIVAESVVLAKRAEPYIRALGRLQIVQYPLVDSTVVTIGKRAGLRLNNKLNFSIDVVGASWLYEAVRDSDVDIASYNSPMANAVLGKSLGERVEAIINTRQTSVEVLELANMPPIVT